MRPSIEGKVDLRPEDGHRLECYALIAKLKDRGLGEAVQSLRNMVEFYTEDLPAALPPAPVRPVRANVSRSYTSTVPPLVEE